ncbi:hypothetical protein GCM10010279_36690 [Streptomyces mutabilis]|nr:hypothetical protein GCM10010279_36690 [Streptomyces mutabilis]
MRTITGSGLPQEPREPGGDGGVPVRHEDAQPGDVTRVLSGGGRGKRQPRGRVPHPGEAFVGPLGSAGRGHVRRARPGEAYVGGRRVRGRDEGLRARPFRPPAREVRAGEAAGVRLAAGRIPTCRRSTPFRCRPCCWPPAPETTARACSRRLRGRAAPRKPGPRWSGPVSRAAPSLHRTTVPEMISRAHHYHAAQGRKPSNG